MRVGVQVQQQTMNLYNNLLAKNNLLGSHRFAIITIHKNLILSRGGAEVAREAHNLKVGGSIPPPATNFKPGLNIL